MPAPENIIKTRLGSNETLIGAWLGLGATNTTELAGRAGFDWCLLDAEHGVYNANSLRDNLIALKAAGCPAGVRVPTGEDWVIKQALDIGAQTLVVPMVESREEAEAAVQSVLYAPAGKRGLAAGVVRASGYGAQSDYLATANAQICLMLQVESRAGVDNVEAIAQTDGVDCVFLGPSDLAADMGFPGQTGAREVQDAFAHVMRVTRDAGKAVGMFCLTPADLAHYHDMGANFIAVASDAVSFRQAMSQRVAEARAALGIT